MEYILPDLESVIRFPNILTLKNPGYKVLLYVGIARGIIDKKDFMNETAWLFLKNNLDYRDPNNTSLVTDLPEQTQGDVNIYLELTQELNLSSLEAGLILIAQYQTMPDGQIILVTSNENLINIANDRNIVTRPIEDYIRYEEPVVEQIEVSENVNKNKKAIKRDVVKNIVIGLVSSGLTAVIITYFNEIINTASIWGTFFGTLITGIVLFIIREKFRLAYGITEFAVGCFSVFLAFPKGEVDYSHVSLDVNFGFKILGSLYIMVRGLDNIVKGLYKSDQGDWLKEKWGIG